jgi:hypothetical protein
VALNQAAHQRQPLKRHLRKAMESEQLSLHYQPIVNLDNGWIIGVEALLRWTDPELGFVPPDQFIPAAEIDFVYFETDDHRTDMLVETGAQGYDLILTSGDVLMVQEHSEDIEYVIPEEGTSLWVDYMVVSRSAPNPQLAWAFINFLNEPGNAAQHAEYLYAPTCNKAAEKLLPTELLEDTQIYPDSATLAKSEAYTRLPPRVAKRRNEIFSRVVN